MGIGTINNLKRERDLGHEYGIKMPRFINEKIFRLHAPIRSIFGV